MSFSRTSKLCVNHSLNKFIVYVCAHKGRIRYQYVSRPYTSSSSRNECGILIRRILEKVKSALSFTDKSQAIDIPLLSPIRGSSSTVVPPYNQPSNNYIFTVSNVKATLDNHVYILKKTVATPKNVIPLCTIDYKYDSNETKKDSGGQLSANLFSYPSLLNDSNKGSSKGTSCLSGAEPALETNRIRSLNSSFYPYSDHDKSNAKTKESLNCGNSDNISIYKKNDIGNSSTNFNEVGQCSNVVSSTDNEAGPNYIDLCCLSKTDSSSKVGKFSASLNIKPFDINTNSIQNTSYYGSKKKLLQGSSNCDNIMVLNPQLPKLRTIFYFHNKNAYIIQPTKLDDLSPVVQYISQLNETNSINKPARINVVEFCKEPVITNKNLLKSYEKSFEMSDSVTGNKFNENKFDYYKQDRQYIIYKKEKSISCENSDNNKYWIPTIDVDVSSISNENEFTAIQNVSDHSSKNEPSNAQFPSKSKKSFLHNQLLDNKDNLDSYTFKIPINKDKLIEETVVPNKSILNIINSIDKSAVIIQKDLYITDRIIQKIKNEKKQQHEKPKLETSNGVVEDNTGEHVLYFDIQSIDTTGNVKLLLYDLINLSKTNEDGIDRSSKTSQKENDISKTNKKYEDEVMVLQNCDNGEILLSKPNMKEVQGIVSFSFIGNTKYKGFSTIDIIKKTAALLQKEKYQQKKVSESKEATKEVNTKRKTNIPLKSKNISKQSPTNFQPNHNLHENEKPFWNIMNPNIIRTSTSNKTNLQEHKVKSNEMPYCLLVKGCERKSINDRGENGVEDKNNANNSQNEEPISTNINNKIEIHSNGNFKEQVLEGNNNFIAHQADIIMKENIQNHVVQSEGNNNTTFDSLDDISVKQPSSLISERSPELLKPDSINREDIKLVNAEPTPMVFSQNGENEVSDSKSLNNSNYSMRSNYLGASASSIIEDTERNRNMETVSDTFIQCVKTNDNNQSKEQFDNNLSPRNKPVYKNNDDTNNEEKYDTIHKGMSDNIPTLECPTLIDNSVKCLMSSKGKNDHGYSSNQNVVSVNNAGSIVKKKTPTITHVTKTSITATKKNGMSDICVSEKETFIDARVPVPFSTETFFQIFGTSMSLQKVTKLVDNTKNQLISSTLSSHITNTKEILSKLDEIINVIKCSQKSSLEYLRNENSKTEALIKSSPQTITNITPKIITSQIQGKNEFGKTITNPITSQNVEKKVSGRKIRLRRQNSNHVAEKGKVTNQKQERPTSSKSVNIKLPVFKEAGKNMDATDRKRDSTSGTEKLQTQMHKKGVKMSTESVKLKTVTIDSGEKRKETATNKKKNVLDNNAVSENINNYVHLLKSTSKKSKSSKSKSKRLGFFEHKSLSKRDKKILKEILKGAPKRKKLTKVRRVKEDPIKSKTQDLKAPSSAGDGPYKPKPSKQGSPSFKLKTLTEKDKSATKPPVEKVKVISEAKTEGCKLAAPKDILQEHKKESVNLTKPENKADKNILSSSKPKEDTIDNKVLKENPLHTKNDTIKYKLDKSSGVTNEEKISEKNSISPTKNTKFGEKMTILSEKVGPVSTNELNSPNEFLQKENKTDPSKCKSNFPQEKGLPLIGGEKITTDNKVKSKSTVEGSLKPKEGNKNTVLKNDKPGEIKSDKDNVNRSNKIVKKELSDMKKPPQAIPNKQKIQKTVTDKVVKSTDKNSEEIQFSGSNEIRTNSTPASSKNAQETITNSSNYSEHLVNKSSSIKSPQKAKKNLELDSSNINTRKNNQENKVSHKNNSDGKTIAKHSELNADIKESKSKDLDLKKLSPQQLAAEKENKSSAAKEETVGPGVNSSPSFQIYVATKTYVDPKNQAKYSPPKSPSLNPNKLKNSVKKAKASIQKAGRRQNFEPPSQKMPNAVNPHETNNSGITVIEATIPEDMEKNDHKEKFKTELMRSVKRKIEMRNPINFRVNSKKITSPQKEPNIKTPESPSKKAVLKQGSKKFTPQQTKHPSKEKKKELSSSHSVAKPANKKIHKQSGKDTNSKPVQLKHKTSLKRLSRGSKTLKVYAERSMKKDDVSFKEIKPDSSTIKDQKLVNASKEEFRSKIKKESPQEPELTKTKYDKSLESKISEVDTKNDKVAHIENIKIKSNQTNDVMRSQLLQENPVKKDIQHAEEVKFNEEKNVQKNQMNTETKNNSEVINKDVNIKLNAQGLKEKNVTPTFSQTGVSKGGNEAEAVRTDKDQIPFPMLLVDLDKMTKEIKPDLDITNCHKCSIPINKIEDYPIFSSKKVGGFVCPNSVLNICPSKDPMLRKDLSFLPSVTKILNLTLSKNSREVLREWRRTMIKELGENGFKSFYKGQMTRGTQFHNLIQDHLIWGRGRETPSTLCFQSVHHVLSELTDLAAINTHVVHKNLAYRGVVDCVAKYKNKPVVVEWKRLDQKEVLGLSSLEASCLQLSAYIGALNFDENYKFQVKGGIIVIAYSDGNKADVHEVDYRECEKYWKLWLSRLQKYHSFIQNRKNKE